MTLEIVVSSRNKAKVAEVIEILSNLPVKLLTTEDVGDWGEIDEPGETFLENALIKARAVAAITGKPSLADDSGLEVDALGGQPGVHSARFAGPHATDEENNAKLMKMMEGKPREKRNARYKCVVALVMPDGSEIAGIGSCEGTIGEDPRGSGGFGYDPYFVPLEESRTMAELSPEEKHAISHRGKALRGLADQLSRVLTG
ncbi:MAG TPA: XTP/dITP diphosphatase [Actinomycetota bacterium]|nr:XTP/dITP diphosphatase [Actinomycetota bacterium]